MHIKLKYDLFNSRSLEYQVLLFSWAPKSLQTIIAAMKLKGACSLEEKLQPT